MRKIAEQRRAPRLLIHTGADVAVEVAIRAFRLAEGPVHVDAEAGILGRVADHRVVLARGRATHRYD